MFLLPILRRNRHSYFLPYQQAWIRDDSPLKIIEKSRQIGMTYADTYDSVMKAAARGADLDVWITSRDALQARLYIDSCRHWAKLLQIAAVDLGEIVYNSEKNLKALVLEFATGCRIYALTSNPDTLAGKPGHVKIDEFALHPHQRDLYRYAMPCTTWGGQLSIISTHRGIATAFNEIIRDIHDRGNPMGWSHHRVTIFDAVQQGIVEKINNRSGRHETRQQFIDRMRAKCIDEEQWLQEFCCVPANENSAFISYEMLLAAEAPGCLLSDATQLTQIKNPLFVGIDVARKNDLCVIDVGEKIGDVLWDRLRIEMRDKQFSEIEFELFRILRIPAVHRCCIDATGLGMQLAERAAQQYPWKVERITFNAQIKERMAFELRTAFEDCRLRIDPDPNLKADLRAIKKLVTPAGNIRFAGETDDSHCDRFWAKALRQHALTRPPIGGIAVA